MIEAGVDGIIRGLRLPRDLLKKIYASNFERLIAGRASPL